MGREKIEVIRGTPSPASAGAFPLSRVVGLWPDPVSDADLLDALLSPEGETARRLAYELWASQTFWGMKLGELFPGLAGVSTSKPVDGVGVRVSNVLLRCDLRDWSAVAATTPVHLARLPNFGSKSFREFIQRTLVAWADHHRNDPDAAAGAAGEDATGPGDATQPIGSHAALHALVPDIREVLSWPEFRSS